MNFLAHLHLSSSYPSEMVGNFIGDYVKGNKFQNYHKEIARGILLHRKIDSFTDQHQITKKCNESFKSSYGRYAGVIVDMVYDHCLANEWEQYSNTSLDEFANNAYDTLFEHYDILPVRVQSFLPKMKAIGRLQSYATQEGILHAIQLMSHYTTLPNNSHLLPYILEHELGEIKTKFSVFYKEVSQYVIEERERLNLTQNL